ncbi:MAG: sulfite exporter TauE/SafE family protein [Desulfobaccales bacterium]
MSAFSPAQFFGFVALGFGVGAYGTLIGAGGGFVLMPLLLLMYPRANPDRLTAISLAVVFCNALSGSAAYARMKRIDYRSGLMFAAAATPGAIVGALQTSQVSREVFDLIFSVVLIAVAVAMVLRPNLEHRPRGGHPLSRWETTRRLVEANGAGHEWTFYPVIGVVLSFFVGYFSSFLGIGGGIIHVPALVWLLHFPVHIATATSHFILAIMALTGTLVHVWNGVLAQSWRETLALSVGVLLGAQLGAYFSNKIKGAWIIRSLAFALGLLGIRILITSLKPLGI